MQKINIELRSDEVQEILTKIPHWLIRWGSMIIVGVLIILILISYFVKYPDIISGNIILTTPTPPEKIIAKTTGKIEAILVNDKDFVVSKTPLAILENSANFKDVFLLKSVIDTISLDKYEFPFSKFINSEFGDIETSFAIFQKEYTSNQLNKKLQPFEVETNAQNFEGSQLKERLQILISQKSINELELELQKKDLQRYEKLFEKGIIATQEIDKQKLIYFQAEKNYKNLLSSISQIKSTLNELNRNHKTTIINQNTTSINMERSVLQSFYQLKNTIKEWELNNVFYSSISGTVSFLQIWSENQTINNGENMFSIIPTSSDKYIGKLKVSSTNSGKLELGQLVNIRLSNYPHNEFGILEGYICNIALIPDKEGLIFIDVKLKNGLSTSYNKKISFKQEMGGSGEVITNDVRLINRFLHQFNEIFKR
jgi:HlyD family secretion protein